MSRLATLVVAVGALALAFVTLSPNSAEAGWRRWGWGPGPGVNVYVGPRHGWYGYRPYYRPYAYHYGYPYGYYPYWRRRYWRRLVLGTRASKAPQFPSSGVSLRLFLLRALQLERTRRVQSR